MNPIIKFKTLINVPYAEKDDAKTHGAFYDKDLKSWYIPHGEDNVNYKYLMSKYGAPKPKNTKIYLNVSYDDKDDAKEHKAYFDSENKAWYTWSNNEHKDYLIANYGEE
jgi:hypothetical protein